jgi:hypothetical protein
MRPEKLDESNHWEPEWKDELVANYPLDGPSPQLDDPSFVDLSGRIGKPPNSVKMMWYNLRGKTGDFRKQKIINGRHRQKWTSEEDEILLRKIPLGEWPGIGEKVVYVLAEELGRTRKAIYERWMELTTLKPVLTPNDEIGLALQELREMAIWLIEKIDETSRTIGSGA